MKRRIPELVVKIASLGAEARIIRRMEEKERRRARVAETQILLVDGGTTLSHRRSRLLDPSLPHGSSEDHKTAQDALALAAFPTPRRSREALVNIAAEARESFRSLHDHRRGAVGREARVALLAYAYLRGRKYAEVEQHNTREAPPWIAVRDCAVRFAGKEAVAAFGEWVDAGVAHLATASDPNLPSSRLANPIL